MAVRQGGEGCAGPDWARSGERAGGVKKKKKETGWAEREGERERIFHFPKRFKHFQFKFKLKDLNLS